MQENEIQVFIDGIKNYFKTVSERVVTVSAPYLESPSNVPCFDYTGIIGVSGKRKGCVYFSAPRILLRHLLLSLGEKDDSPEFMQDIVGEVANTVSGNARSSFGSEFMISVPVVVQGVPEWVQLPKALRSFVIPIQWNNYTASLIVCLG